MGKVNNFIERLTGKKPNPIYVIIHKDSYIWEWDPIDECPEARSVVNREAEVLQVIYALQRYLDEIRAKAKPIEEAAQIYFGERYKPRC